MQIEYGDLWDYADSGSPIVVPINIGWTRDGRNVMGRGVAAQAAARFPELPTVIGDLCREDGAATPVIAVKVFRDTDGQQYTIIPFPVKPLARNPALSWQQRADVTLIMRSAAQLLLLVHGYHFESVALPLVGCGNGGLAPELVIPILKAILYPDTFTLVLQSAPAPPADAGEYEWLELP